LLGGLLGARFVTVVIISVPNVGMALTIFAAIIGQVAISMISFWFVRGSKDSNGCKPPAWSRVYVDSSVLYLPEQCFIIEQQSFYIMKNNSTYLFNKMYNEKLISPK
jgi:hypothetical protein